MNTKISFHNMTHSLPLEEHTRSKLAKILDIVKHEADQSPFQIEVWLKANAQHPHHRAEVHVKTAHFNFHTHDETGADMYVSIDNAIDKMVEMLKKEKERRRDARRTPNTEKANFQK